MGIFFFFSFVGFFVLPPEPILGQIFKFIRELLDKTQKMSMAELIRFIFLNNLQSSFFSMTLGVFLGIFPIIAIILNGYMLGFVASFSVKSQGVFILWKILPHGIFELPAIFISTGLGLRLGISVFKKKKEKKLEQLKKNFWRSFKVFLLVVIPLLIIAAIIEGSLIFLMK